MKLKTLLTATAFVALLAGGAYAQSMTVDNKASATIEKGDRTAGNNEENVQTGASFEAGVKDAGKDAVGVVEGFGDAVASAAKDIKANLLSEDEKADTEITVSQKYSAHGMIGSDVLNVKGEKIAKVKDIIVDADGNAKMIIVSDGQFMGMGGKLAAFDYNMVMKRSADGDVFMPLTEDSIAKVQEFSYDAKDVSKKVRTLPAGMYSVDAMLHGDLLDGKGKDVGNIDNLVFKDGKAEQVIVNYGSVLGVGGDNVAFNFNTLTLGREDNDKVSFKMNDNQSVRFETYKKEMNG